VGPPSLFRLALISDAPIRQIQSPLPQFHYCSFSLHKSRNFPFRPPFPSYFLPLNLVVFPPYWAPSLLVQLGCVVNARVTPRFQTFLDPTPLLPWQKPMTQDPTPSVSSFLFSNVSFSDDIRFSLIFHRFTSIPPHAFININGVLEEIGRPQPCRSTVTTGLLVYPDSLNGTSPLFLFLPVPNPPFASDPCMIDRLRSGTPYSVFH